MHTMKTARENIQARLHQILVDRRLTLDQLAHIAGLSPNTCQRVFAGKNTTIDTAEAIANSLGLSLAQLVSGGDPTKLPHDELNPS